MFGDKSYMYTIMYVLIPNMYKPLYMYVFIKFWSIKLFMYLDILNPILHFEN